MTFSWVKNFKAPKSKFFFYKLGGPMYGHVPSQQPHSARSSKFGFFLGAQELRDPESFKSWLAAVLEIAMDHKIPTSADLNNGVGPVLAHSLISR
jgi:hypothetical protein